MLALSLSSPPQMAKISPKHYTFDANPLKLREVIHSFHNFAANNLTPKSNIIFPIDQKPEEPKSGKTNVRPDMMTYTPHIPLDKAYLPQTPKPYSRLRTSTTLEV